MDYSAIAIHPSLPDGRESGTLSITPVDARFKHEGITLSIPLSGVVLRRGGSANRLIFFEAPEMEGSIYTTDAAVLRDPELLANPMTAAAIARISSEKRRGLAILLGTLAAIALVLFGLGWFRAPLVAVVARRVPLSVERKIGDLAMQQIRLSATEVREERVLAPLRSIVKRLEGGESAYDFELHVIDDPAVNAFALPGGHLALHRGLLLEAESGEEIAGVLAHEMAHVTEQHSLRQMISTIGLYALVQALLGDASALIAAAAEGGARLAELGFSRDAERDADRAGLQMLHRAALDPSGMLTFFEKLRTVERSRGVAGQAADELAFLSTHPATSERIERLKEMTAAMPSREYRPAALDVAALHEALRHPAREVKE